MSFIGAGSEDWPEFDLDGVDLDARAAVHALVNELRPRLERMVRGPFETVDLPGARVHLVVDEKAKALAQVSASGRLIVTYLNDSGRL